MKGSGSVVLYPFLFAAFPAVSLYAHNVNETLPGELIPPLACALPATFAVWWVFRKLTGDPHRAGLITLLAVAFFFTAGRATEAVNALSAAVKGGKTSFQETFLTHEVVGVQVLVSVLLAALAWKRLKTPAAWTPPLNAFATIGLALPLATAAPTLLGGFGRSDLVRSELKATETPDPAPDVYYILLDGFGREDVLRDLFDYDLRPFLDALHARGFFVADQAIANYSQTRLSLASSLNGAYLDPLRGEQADERPLRSLIHRSGIVDALRSRGYRFLNFDSGYHLTEDIPADEVLSAFTRLSEFQRILLRQTAVALVSGTFGFNDPFVQTRARTRFALEQLPEIAKRPEPTFTFAHILCPHPPFVFGAHGEDVAPRSYRFSIDDGDAYVADTPDDYVNGYRAQAAFLAKQMEIVVDRILANSATPPIILIQGDHGPGSRLVHDDPEATDLRERMSILSAYLTPGKDPAAIGLTPQMTPVNSFRVMLDAYFGAKLGKLPEKSYFSRWHAPFDFLDVTAKVRPEPGTAPKQAEPVDDADPAAAETR